MSSWSLKTHTPTCINNCRSYGRKCAKVAGEEHDSNVWCWLQLIEYVRHHLPCVTDIQAIHIWWNFLWQFTIILGDVVIVSLYMYLPPQAAITDVLFMEWLVLCNVVLPPSSAPHSIPVGHLWHLRRSVMLQYGPLHSVLSSWTACGLLKCTFLVDPFSVMLLYWICCFTDKYTCMCACTHNQCNMDLRILVLVTQLHVYSCTCCPASHPTSLHSSVCCDNTHLSLASTQNKCYSIAFQYTYTYTCTHSYMSQF